MDVVAQLVNEATNTSGFLAAAVMVRNHIRTNRNPEINHVLLVGLAMRGYYLISQGCDAQVITEAVMRTLTIEPNRIEKVRRASV